jgi:hypothetical protein
VRIRWWKCCRGSDRRRGQASTTTITTVARNATPGCLWSVMGGLRASSSNSRPCQTPPHRPTSSLKVHQCGLPRPLPRIMLLIQLTAPPCPDEPYAGIPRNREAATEDQNLILRFVDFKNRRHHQPDEHCSTEKHDATEAEANPRIADKRHTPHRTPAGAGRKSNSTRSRTITLRILSAPLPATRHHKRRSMAGADRIESLTSQYQPEKSSSSVARVGHIDRVCRTGARKSTQNMWKRSGAPPTPTIARA